MWRSAAATRKHAKPPAHPEAYDSELFLGLWNIFDILRRKEAPMPEPIRITLLVHPLEDSPGEVSPIDRDSLEAFLRHAGLRGDLSSSTVSGGSRRILFDSLEVVHPTREPL